MLRSCDSCLRSALVLRCRPCRWSCICRRDTETGWLAPKEGGGIRARGADGVRAAQPTADGLHLCSVAAQKQKLSQNSNKIKKKIKVEVLMQEIMTDRNSLKFWQKDSGQFLTVQQLRSQRIGIKRQQRELVGGWVGVGVGEFRGEGRVFRMFESLTAST